MDEFIKREDALKALRDLPNVCGCSAVDRTDAEDAIMDCPTADVVPKQAYAEYEETTGLKKAKQEVAREIFEEIEFEIHQLDFDREETRAIAIEGIIANVKKKYTEGE